MAEKFNYETFVARNKDYVSQETQEKIRNTKLLIAGCGIGSSPAVCAARMGFENFILADGDTVAAHNLNRQFYEFADVDKYKVEALKDKILKINPQARVEAIAANLDAKNTEDIVARAGIVFDTIDFIDLSAIVLLHNSAKKFHKPIFTAFNVGFGALVWYFPAESGLTLLDIIAPDMAKVSAGGIAGYMAIYESFISRLAPHLDRDVVLHVDKVLTMMKEGTPCPASQIAVGSFAVGALAVAMIHDMLAGDPVPTAPHVVIHSFKNHQTKIVQV